MILAGDLKPGTKFIYNNEPYSVVDVVFVKPGKGGAFARTKMKNLITSLMREVTFSTDEKVTPLFLNYKTVQYLYNQGNKYFFMDQDSYEEVSIDKDNIKETISYLVEQEIYTLVFWESKLLNINPPIHMNMVVIDTMPGVRGDTAQGSVKKSATMSTGLIVQVPLFINIDDIIRIDTRTSEYVERIKK